MLRLSELAKGDFLALDIEGDGNKNQRPVEISVCEFSHGAFVREHHWLINPERPISYFARVKHGIGDRKVRSAPKFTEVKEEIANLLAGRVVVAHDMTGDLLMLGEVDPSIIEYPGQIVCTYRMAKRVLPARQPVSPGVTSLSAWLGIDREMPDGLRRKTVHSARSTRGGWERYLLRWRASCSLTTGHRRCSAGNFRSASNHLRQSGRSWQSAQCRLRVPKLPSGWPARLER